MNKRVEKIVAKMKKTKAGHSFEDCEKVLIASGYYIAHSKGSHFTFKKETTKHRIVIAKHKPVDKQAIDDVIEAYETNKEKI